MTAETEPSDDPTLSSGDAGVETIVLPTEVYVSGRAHESAMDGLQALIADAVGDLAVETEITVRDDGFVSVRIQAGESSPSDATAARSLLQEIWGRFPAETAAGETYVGTLVSWDDGGIALHVGADRTIRIDRNDLGLGPGSGAEIVERFGLVQHQPMRFVAGDPPRLADEERDRLYDWRRGSGRVTVNSTTRGGLRATINRAGHADDIVTIERLGLLEQSVITGSGTDPPGLVAAIGPHLPASMRCVLPE